MQWDQLKKEACEIFLIKASPASGSFVTNDQVKKTIHQICECMRKSNSMEETLDHFFTEYVVSGYFESHSGNQKHSQQAWDDKQYFTSKQFNKSFAIENSNALTIVLKHILFFSSVAIVADQQNSPPNFKTWIDLTSQAITRDFSSHSQVVIPYSPELNEIGAGHIPLEHFFLPRNDEIIINGVYRKPHDFTIQNQKPTPTQTSGACSTPFSNYKEYNYSEL